MPRHSNQSPTEPRGTLYLVATPIGNLEDITLRALRILEHEVALIAAEDTRRTAKLLNHYGIHTITTSFHVHNERKKQSSLIQRLACGDSLALVSDAGTPLLSDPGSHLVRQALADGIPVQTVPGPNAAVAGLVMSGLAEDSFTFVGFPPHRSKARTDWLLAISNEPRPLILFESPHRIRTTLQKMMEIFGDRLISVCREITKIHECLVTGPISEVLNKLSEPRGEYTLVISPADQTIEQPININKAMARNLFGYLTKQGGFSRRTAIRKVAQVYGLTSREVYLAIEEGKTV